MLILAAISIIVAILSIELLFMFVLFKHCKKIIKKVKVIQIKKIIWSNVILFLKERIFSGRNIATESKESNAPPCAPPLNANLIPPLILHIFLKGGVANA